MKKLKKNHEASNSAPQDFSGSAPSWALNIKPNYERIRWTYLIIAFVGSFVVFIMQIAIYLVFVSDSMPLEFKMSPLKHLYLYLIIPSTINFTDVLIALLINKYYRKNDGILNAVPVIAMAIMCIVTATCHSVYPVTMALLCIPIFMSSVYGNKMLLDITTKLCFVGLACVFISRKNSPYRKEVLDTTLIPETIITAVLIVVAAMIAYTMIILLNKQKERLIEATKSAHYSSVKAREANKAKSEFLANMSHEIRTPLNAIIGTTEIITRRANNDEIVEYAGDIQQASNVLLAIINDILDISKIESGKMQIREAAYELGSLINDSYNMVAIRWVKKGLTANVICDPNLPRVLYGDEYHLRQVVINLLTNAVKYTNEGSIELRVSGERDNDILKMEIAIKDTGIGIRDEDIPNLFDKFNRFDSQKNQNIEGAGLGLAVVKQIVDLMNGTVDVESTYGVGSTFTVRIPQKIVDETPIGDIRSTYLDVHGEIEKYHHSFEAPKAKILVVDDVPVNLQVISRLLDSTKIQVDTATSGKECINKVLSNKYDLILMDQMMPKMSGSEALAEIKKLDNNENTNIPIIMLTANAMMGAREESIQAGFTDYLSKPVRGIRLEQIIKRYLPKEKIIEVSPADAPVSEENESCTFIEKLNNALSEIDTTSGLSFCADDEDFYKSMLNDYSKAERGKSLIINFENSDWHNYQIEAHTLKSSSKMIGFNKLSDEFLVLEKAAKEGRIDIIKENHNKTVEHYNSVIEKLKNVL